MFELTGKTALVTGSTQGIGYAIAKALIAQGAKVYIHCSRDEGKAKRVAAELGSKLWAVADLSDMDEVRGLREKTGDVDLLILNASVQYKEAWDAISEETFDKQINVNIKSTLMLMQSYSPAMKEKGFGRIVTIGSVNQHRQHPELPMYSATKCAVMSLVKNIAKQLAPYGVTVNNVAPGAIATPRNANVYNDAEQRKNVERTIPAGRFGTPEDCVGTVILLCSEQGAYMTGDDILVDGGLHL